jgi:hypothetical protein
MRDAALRRKTHDLDLNHWANRGGFPSPRHPKPPRLDKPKLRQQLRNPECVQCLGFFFVAKLRLGNYLAELLGDVKRLEGDNN